MKSSPDQTADPIAAGICDLGHIGLAAAINQAGQAVLITDRHGDILYANAAFTRITGYSIHEVIGRNTRMLKSGEQDPGYYRDLWESLNAGRNWHGQLMNRRQDGSLYLEEMTIAPVRDSQGNIDRYIALKQDVTERRKSEEAQRFLAAIVASSDDAIFSKTLDGTISSWNQGAEVLYGYRADEAVGKPISILIPPDRQDEISYLIDSIKIGRKLSQFETVRITKDGRRIDVSLIISAIRDAAGKIIGAANITHGISERRRAEQAVRDSEEAAFKAKEVAEEANRVKGEFLANISHELRTPMNGVIGIAALLLGTELTAEQRQLVEILCTSSHALLTTINDILDFSKIDAGKLELEIVDFDLPATVEDAIRLLWGKAREKGLATICVIGPDVPLRLRGDVGHLRQVLLNLVGNAVKFTAGGKVTVRVHVDRQDERTAVIRFLVEDTGIGIPTDRHADIFSPFTQVDSSTTRRYGGTGLGLSISRQLVYLLGGQIGVGSEPGKGATFWFTAAFEKQADESQPPAEHLAGLQTRILIAGHDGTLARKREYRPGEATNTDSGKDPYRRAQIDRKLKDSDGIRIASIADRSDACRGRILIAEDNITNQLVALAILKKLGYQATVVANGKEALAALRSISYDLVLMDCQMPELNGYEAVAHIRDPQSKICNPNIPIIALTAHAMRGDRKKCLDAGMDDYIAKPIHPTTLARLLEKWMPQEGASR